VQWTIVLLDWKNYPAQLYNSGIMTGEIEQNH
jgi:hypothetical protein